MKSLVIMLVALTATISSFAQKANAPQTKRNVVQVNQACSLHIANPSLSKKEQMKADVTKATHSCPVHTALVNNHSTKCPNCRAQFVVERTGSKQVKKVYVCTMQPDLAGNDAGKCPVCNMNLQKTKLKNEGKKS